MTGSDSLVVTRPLPLLGYVYPVSKKYFSAMAAPKEFKLGPRSTFSRLQCVGKSMPLLVPSVS